jgi:signal transduction histidine kinase
MIRKSISFKFKFFFIISIFFIFFIISAIVLFINFKNDKSLDKQLAFYAYNTNAIQNIYSSFSNLFYLSYKYSKNVSYEARRDFVHLANSLDYQFHSFLTNATGYGQEYLITIQREYEFYLEARELTQRLFEANISETKKNEIVVQLATLEDKVLAELHAITNENYAKVSKLFRKRTKSYETFFNFYVISLFFFLFFGFGSLIIFYINNFSKPYKKFLESIECVKNGIFNKKVSVIANKEFQELGEAFNSMIERLDEIDKQLMKHIENIEEIVDEKTKQVEEKNYQLMQLDKLKDQFLQNISHELRTPLTSILGYLEIVLNYGNTPKTQENFLKIAHENSLSLLKTINKLLFLSEVEAGDTKLTVNKFNLYDLILNIIKKMKILADKKNITLDLVVENNINNYEIFIEADEDKIESVFSNLIANAIKFTEKGGIKIIIISEKNKNIIKVIDTGIGILDKDKMLIFDKFQQVDNSLTKIYEGTGLGLSIVKNILELHGGEIELESVYGEGSVFSVILYK